MQNLKLPSNQSPGMKPDDILAYYSDPRISEAICSAASGREAVGRYGGENYDTRPNIIQYPADIVQLVRKGMTSFHISVERWKYPMTLSTEHPERYDKLRSGWDFIIDIDSSIGVEGAKISAILIADLLKKYGITPGVKFSGSRGFHICIPFEDFPQEIDFKPMATQYPRVPQMIAEFIQEKISDKLLDELLARYNLKDLLAGLGEPPSELSPFLFVEIEKGWGVRHLFRAPYSLNEKSWLVSVPIKYDKLHEFFPDSAKPNVVLSHGKIENFFVVQKGAAERLLIDAMDFYAVRSKEEPKSERKEIRQLSGKIPEQHFPPCIKAILEGLRDGKKRSTFTLINFLRHANWSIDEIEDKIKKWNSSNTPPLPASYINSQLHYFSRQRLINPANCSSNIFYKSIGICRPDRICTNNTNEIKIKNPLSYPHKSIGIALRLTQRAESRLDSKNAKIGFKKQAGRGFACDLCSREFATMRSLHMHRSRTHGISD